MSKLKPPKAYQDFFSTLSICGLLLSPYEGVILALVNKGSNVPRWQTVIDICATREAHKRGIR